MCAIHPITHHITLRQPPCYTHIHTYHGLRSIPSAPRPTPRCANRLATHRHTRIAGSVLYPAPRAPCPYAARAVRARGRCTVVPQPTCSLVKPWGARARKHAPWGRGCPRVCGVLAPGLLAVCARPIALTLPLPPAVIVPRPCPRPRPGVQLPRVQGSVQCTRGQRRLRLLQIHRRPGGVQGPKQRTQSPPCTKLVYALLPFR